ncbi:MAG: hypothetical protein LBV49_05815 [Azonexus sp.]|nr:hypothetical protein [Azonexus sp.]
MRLTLLIPQLLWPEPGDQETPGDLPTPGFGWLTARATRRRSPALPFEAALAASFGLAALPSPPALGALRLLGEDTGEEDTDKNADKTAADGYWLCADPAHLRFHHERIVLADAGAFELSLDEAEELAAALNAEFADLGQLHVATARRWYLRLNPDGDHFAGACRHVAPPLSAVAGKRVDNQPPAADATLTRWLNEAQMLLHNHPLNARREARGQPTINSLWLWGGGALKRPPPGCFTAVWSDHPLAIGLARAGGTPAHPLPENFAAFTNLASTGSNALLVLDSLLAPALYEDGEAWRNAWQALENDWFAPLAGEPGGVVKTLTIVAPTVYGNLNWSLAGRDRWKFWRRSQTLAALAGELAPSPRAIA